MVSCVFPGSFDPVTRGHLDLIQRASSAFDHVTVAVMYNIHKKGTIPVEKRVELLKKVCSTFQNVSIDRWDGLLADYMRIKKEIIVIRGIRGGMEAEQEILANAANRMLNNQMETLFLPTAPELAGVSSSAVREVYSFGGDISAFVPKEITEEIKILLSKKK